MLPFHPSCQQIIIRLQEDTRLHHPSHPTKLLPHSSGSSRTWSLGSGASARAIMNTSYSNAHHHQQLLLHPYATITTNRSSSSSSSNSPDRLNMSEQKLLSALEDTWLTTADQFRLDNVKIITNGSLHKLRHPEKYDLVIVDEAHKFRNDTADAFDELQRICKTPTSRCSR